jgi:hypothetical protein
MILKLLISKFKKLKKKVKKTSLKAKEKRVSIK